jgi:hypothetical protein
MKYNKVHAQLLFSICKALGTETTKSTHTHTDQTTDRTQKTRTHVIIMLTNTTWGENCESSWVQV